MRGWYKVLRIAGDRDRLSKIFALALPIVGGMVSQNILNLIDTLMVSQLGKEALAAVGMGGFVNFLSTAFITGLAVGVQAMAARRKGEGRDSETAVALNGGLLMVVVFSIPMTVATVALAPVVFPYLVDFDADVVAIGVPYLQVRLLSMIAVEQILRSAAIGMALVNRICICLRS